MSGQDSDGLDRRSVLQLLSTGGTAGGMVGLASGVHAQSAGRSLDSGTATVSDEKLQQIDRAAQAKIREERNRALAKADDGGPSALMSLPSISVLPSNLPMNYCVETGPTYDDLCTEVADVLRL